jgi:DNA modification methylase
MACRTGELTPAKYQIEYRDPKRLKVAEGNPKNHNPKQIRLIGESIKRFGFLNPIIINRKGRVLAGHGRLATALQLGLATVPVIVVSNLSEVDERAFLVADNRLAELGGGWDRKLLAQQFEFILESDADFDLELTGFDLGAIEIILDQDQQPLVSVPEAGLRTGPLVSQSGDLWQLGRHRLLCGDALQCQSYATLMGRTRARLIFSDPPYNLRVSSIVGRGRTSYREFENASGEMSESEYIAFLTTSFSLMAKFSVDGSLHYICIDWRHLFELLTAGRATFDALINLCVFAKPSPGLGAFYRSQHELVAVFKRGTRAHHNGIELGRHGRNRSNLWCYGESSLSKERQRELELHPTVKPLPLVANAILDASRRDDIILDPFGGSGTTLLAAEQTNRQARLIEIDPVYCDVILRRFREATGIEPVDSDGTPFSERQRLAEPGEPEARQ